MKQADCVFCQFHPFVLENDLAGAFFDHAPVSKGHMLIIPKEHFETFFDAPVNVQQAMIALLDDTEAYLTDQYQPEGFQVFSHIGAAANQRVFHAHIHIVPVY